MTDPGELLTTAKGRMAAAGVSPRLDGERTAGILHLHDLRHLGVM